MALNPSTEFPGRITAPDANYTYGSSKDESSPGAGDGTPYVISRANDLFGLQQALLRLASIVPSGNADTQLVSQYLQSIVELASGRANTYDESGAADVYVADLRANQQAPAAYFDDLTIKFTPGNANTGASTVDVAGLGVVDIRQTDGGVLLAGMIPANVEVELAYDTAGGYFVFTNRNTPGVGQVWQDLSGSRAAGVTYTNTTGRVIKVAMHHVNQLTSLATGSRITIDGSIAYQNTVPGANLAALSAAPALYVDIPPGSTYQLTLILGVFNSWFELR